MNTNHEFVYTSAGPYHAEGTLIYREGDGTLMRDCPNCGTAPVILRHAADLEKYGDA